MKSLKALAQEIAKNVSWYEPDCSLRRISDRAAVILPILRRHVTLKRPKYDYSRVEVITAADYPQPRAAKKGKAK